MGNDVAIAAVTTAICYVLEQSVAAQPGESDQARVTWLSPGGLAASMAGEDGMRGLNVYLYEVVPTRRWTDTELPTRLPPGTVRERATACCDLRFIISAYGQDLYLEPQRLLARALLALAATPVLTQDVITAAIAHFAGRGGLEFLAGSDLAQQEELVRLAPQTLGPDDVARLRDAFGAPFSPFLGYSAGAVMLGTS
jgi:hypothetical protein